MNWEEWITANKKELEHVAGYEEQFVRCVLKKVPEIRPEDVTPQYHFTDSNGGNRYIDFMIINKSKGYKLPIELDGYWKVKTYYEFDDMLKRQNDLVKIYGVLLRYTNKKMENDPQGIIDEIRNTLHLQNTDQLSKEVTESQTAKRLREYQSQLAWYEEQLELQKKKEKEQAKKFKEEQDKLSKAEQAIKAKENKANETKDIITKSDIEELQATISALQSKVEEVSQPKTTPYVKPLTDDGYASRKKPLNDRPLITNKSIKDSKKAKPTKLTVSHMVGIGSASLIVIALGANSYFSKKEKEQSMDSNPVALAGSSLSHENEDNLDSQYKPQKNVTTQIDNLSDSNYQTVSNNTHVQQPINSISNEGSLVSPTSSEGDSSYDAAISSAVPAAKAYQHIGSYRVVCGNVAQVKEFSKGTYLNLGATYPNQDATIVVWDSDNNGLGQLEQFEGQDLCIKGTIDSYKRTPQIKLSSSSQLM